MAPTVFGAASPRKTFFVSALDGPVKMPVLIVLVAPGPLACDASMIAPLEDIPTPLARMPVPLVVLLRCHAPGSPPGVGPPRSVAVLVVEVTGSVADPSRAMIWMLLKAYPLAAEL